VTVKPYGSWPSPLSAAQVAAGALRFDHLVIDGEDLYWVEGRSSEAGRSVVVRRTPDGQIVDVTPPGFSVRTRVHEYGGAAYTAHRGTVYFSNFTDQVLYRQAGNKVPEPLTTPGHFYADARIDPARTRLIAIREDHSRAESAASHDSPAAIVAIGIEGSSRSERVLIEGADFYSDAVLDPGGSRLAWLQWNHPNMPWDGTELWVADLSADGSIRAHRKIAGGPSESIFQPEWSPAGDLFFVSDRTGWWNLYTVSDRNILQASHHAADPRIEPIWPMSAEFGKPQWTFSQKTYAFVTANRLAATYIEDGRWKLALIDVGRRAVTPLDLPIEAIEAISATPQEMFFIGGSPIEPLAIVRVSLPGQSLQVVRSSKTTKLEPRWISAAQPIAFDSGGSRVHAFYYAPHNPDAEAPAGDRPPLLVVSHGGPTSAAIDVLDEEIQFWTSRGFAVLDVNYRGSTGYGREYRDRVKGQWGIIDVADCVNGARHLVEANKADPARLIIRGRSAGGYTTLAALTFHDVFRAGASYYGISDVEVLARDTHKFESRYLDSLIGPYPEARERYRERSPIHSINRLSCALILFQGLEDEVVPPNQAEMMADAVRRKGLPVAYLAFEGEQHGFRKAETIIRSLESELYFYGAVFGFQPADRIERVPIDNLR
jgi:dipeptidyl aminopeptidase/acylaminoacyl peptidase